MADGSQVTNPKVAVRAVVEVAMSELVSFNELRKRVACSIKSFDGTAYAIDRDNGVIMVHGELYGEPFELLITESVQYKERVLVSTW